MPRYTFNLPLLPKPEYEALKRLTERYKATQLEMVCVGLRLICEAVNHETSRTAINAGDIDRLLKAFRETAPSEQPALLRQ